jgi:hypothetical protein
MIWARVFVSVLITDIAALECHLSQANCVGLQFLPDCGRVPSSSTSP